MAEQVVKHIVYNNEAMTLNSIEIMKLRRERQRAQQSLGVRGRSRQMPRSRQMTIVIQEENPWQWDRKKLENYVDQNDK